MTSPETVAQMASALAFIVEGHRPDTFVNGAHQMLTCAACSQLAGIPIEWPCPDRQAVGTLLPDPTNRLLTSDATPPSGVGRPGGPSG